MHKSVMKALKEVYLGNFFESKRKSVLFENFLTKFVKDILNELMGDLEGPTLKI